MLVGCDIVDKIMRVSFYNEEGKLELLQLNLPDGEMFNWYDSDKPTNYKSWNGNSIMPIATQSLTRYRIEELLLKYFKGEFHDKIYARNMPRITYLDIENDVPDSGEFTEANLAEYPINTISIVNNDNVIILSTLKQLSIEEMKSLEKELNEYFKQFNAKFSIFFRRFPIEGDMLNFFANAVLPKLGFIAGWKVVEYDWTYIYNRCVKLGVNLLGRMPTMTTQGQYHIPTHLGIVDFCEATKEFRFIEKLENFKLGTVSNYLFGLDKLENPYNTMKEFMQDEYRFMLYNIIDSCLVKYINETLLISEAIASLCTISQVEISKIFSNVYVSNLIYCREFAKDGLYFPVQKGSNNKKIDTYEGAYIKEPEKGFKKNIGSFDFRAMYISLGIQFDISPEAYLGRDESKCVGKQYVKTAVGTIFDTSKQSVTARMFTRYLDKRFEYKRMMNERKAEYKKLQCGN